MKAKSPTLTENTSQQLLKGIQIPAQPQIMVDLQMETASANTTLRKIADIISKDIGISGSVLKVVNSPFFGLQTKITSIQQALSLLGIENIINIVNALSLRQSLSKQSFAEMTKIWDSAMDIAMAAAAIAKKLQLASADEAYSLGLFHNCGISLLMDKFENYFKILNIAYAEPTKLITEVENSHLDCNHAVVGYYVAKAWKLPQHVCEAIADHHKTETIFAEKSDGDKSKKDLLAILKLAEHSCRTYNTLGKVQTDHEFSRVKPDLLTYIGFSDYDLDDLLFAIREMHHS